MRAPIPVSGCFSCRRCGATHRLYPPRSESSYATVGVDNVLVPTERVLGSSGQADEPLARALDSATVTLAAEIVGTCQSIFEMTLQYAKDRVQFGKPIGAFQAIQHKLANMLIAPREGRARSATSPP